jgi:hypothetical protein
MTLREFGCLLTVAAVVALLAANGDRIYDEFIEGDYDPKFLEAGRHAGEWEFCGDERELAEFAGAPWHRIRFDLAPVNGAQDALVIGGAPQPFTMDAGFWGTRIFFEHPLPGVTARAYGRRLEITLEAKMRPSNDWLYVCFGDDFDSSRRHFPYKRP